MVTECVRCVSAQKTSLLAGQHAAFLSQRCLRSAVIVPTDVSPAACASADAYARASALRNVETARALDVAAEPETCPRPRNQRAILKREFRWRLRVVETECLGSRVYVWSVFWRAYADPLLECVGTIASSKSMT